MRLPAHAPDRNSVEAVWSWLKGGRLANYVPNALHASDDRIIEYLVAPKLDPGLLRAVGKRADLLFPAPPRKQLELPAGQ